MVIILFMTQICQNTLIPFQHDRLFILLKERIKDSGILNIIKQWLCAPKQLKNGELQASIAGTPQGGVISPLLSNIYLHAFDRIVSNPNGKFAKANIRIVRYADDFVLMGTTITVGKY
jgi:RNA-directed DNA polymerase